jgi:drug/metabolite transporter (DMT)-like permease
MSVVWFRFAMAFSLLFIYFTLRNPSGLKIIVKPPILILVAGLGLGFNYLLFMLGLELTNPSVTNIIIQVAPIMLAGVGIFVYKEKVSFTQILGFLIAMTGFTVFYFNQLNSGADVHKDLDMGVFITILAAIVWVVYAALVKPLSKKHTTMELNLVLYLIPVIMFGFWVDYGGFFLLELTTIYNLMFLGLNTVLAYGMIGEALKLAPANKVAIIITLNPIITLISMAILDAYEFEWLGKEVTNIYGYFGAVLVVVGAIFVVLSKSEK